jgi:TonB family protein
MRKPHYFTALHLRRASLCCLLLLFSFAFGIAHAQQLDPVHEDTASAIERYEKGHYARAIVDLSAIVEKRKDDAVAWYYLGLAHKSEGRGCDAVKALDRVIVLRPQHAEAHANLALVLVMGSDVKRGGLMAQRAMELGVKTAEMHYVLAEAGFDNGNYAEALAEADKALTLDPKLADALLTKATALHGLKREYEAIEALSAYVAANPDADDAASWRQSLALWQADLQGPKKAEAEPKSVVYKPSEVTVKALILSKPPPEYTEKARRACISGTVVIQAVLSSNGKVTGIRTVSGLRGGLTAKAINAAREIKFEPAVKDGSPVSQYIRVEYNFNIY